MADSTHRMTDNERTKFNNFSDLLLKMMHLDPSKRITPAQALKHPFCAIRKKKSKTKSKSPRVKGPPGVVIQSQPSTPSSDSSKKN
eukprot:UN00997